MVKDLFNSDQCNNITSKVLLFLVCACIHTLEITYPWPLNELVHFRARHSGWCCELWRSLSSMKEVETFPCEEPSQTWWLILRSSSTSRMCKIQLFSASQVNRVVKWSCAECVAVLCFSYREKAIQDAAAVSRHVEYLLQSVGKVSLLFYLLVFCILLQSLTFSLAVLDNKIK